MAWFILARLLFFVGVTYTATAVQPLPWGLAANAAFGAALASVAIVLESRLADVNVPRILGAVLGAALGLLFAGLIDRALLVTDDSRWIFFHRVVDLLFPYMGFVIGARRGEWLEPSRLVTLFRATAPSGGTRSSTPASSSTGAWRTSARPASWTARWWCPSSC